MVFFLVGADDGPVGGGEPGVEGVFVSTVFYSGDFDFGKVCTSVEDPFGAVVVFVDFLEHGDGDTPRDLSRDIPIFEAFEVVDEDFLFVRGVELNLAVFEVLDGYGSEFFGVDKPLFF